MRIEDIKDKNVYLLDFSYHLYRCYYSLQSLTITLPTGVVKPSGHIYGMINTIIKIRDYDPSALIFMCIDGYPQERKQLCEANNVAYKADRPKLQYSIHQDTNLICEFLYHIPDVYTVENDYQEADDLMFAVAKKLDKSNNVFIYTTDADLTQTLDTNISIIKKWSSYAEPELLTIDSYYEDEKLAKKFAKTQPNHLPFFRALCGDSSDNIKGIPRIPRVLAALIADNMEDPEQYHDVVRLFSKQVKPSMLKYLQMIEDDADRIIVNYKIMRLSSDIDFDIVREPKPIKDLLHTYQLGKFENWLKLHRISII